MYSDRQTTMNRETMLEGVGLHGGVMCRMILRPAIAGTGVAFRFAGELVDANAPTIAATVDAVVDTRLCTRIGAGGRSIGTIEHLLAAATIAGLDNVIVEIDSDELPALDGSASPIVDAIAAAGLKVLTEPRTVLRIVDRVESVDGDRSIIATPADDAELSVAIDYPDRAIGAQSVALSLSDGASLKRLARARTFCRLADIDAMRASGLARGGDLDNAIVVDGDRIVNGPVLRDPQEFALHKALDLLGDLRLAGRRIVGRIEATRPGHDLNVRFVRRLLAAPTAFRIETAPSTAAPALQAARR